MVDEIQERGDQSELSNYCLKAKQYPVLSHKEMKRLAGQRDRGLSMIESGRLKEGNKLYIQAKEKMIVSNLLLVVYIVNKYFQNDVQFMPKKDMIQEGNLGLIKAVEKYKPKSGNRFSTYAFWWIHSSIESGIIMKTKQIRLSYHKSRRLKKKIIDQIPLSEIENQYLATCNEIRSYDDDSEDSGQPIFQMLPIFSKSEDEQDKILESLQEAISCLTPKEAKVIRLKFGINTEPVGTIHGMARYFDCHPFSLYHIEKRAISKLAQCAVLKKLLPQK